MQADQLYLVKNLATIYHVLNKCKYSCYLENPFCSSEELDMFASHKYIQ